MGKMKNHLQDWLETYGYRLGYDISNAPDLPDLWWVADSNVDSQPYWEGKNEEWYWGVLSTCKEGIV